ncbi:DUF805 domain-containing protein [Bacillus salacetis]|uniref:DUF805 domain-containing protein n=1 Tax=Bacillus salacetis TaxID=2315464 RepID=UPI003BA1747D
MKWYLKVLRNYVNFSGRARRKEYWMFMLFNFIISIPLIAIETMADLDEWLTTLYSLLIFLPSFAVLVRRLHDTGRSGWWVLISLVPLVGAIVLLVFACLDSEDGQNKWGPNPKY